MKWSDVLFCLHGWVKIPLGKDGEEQRIKEGIACYEKYTRNRHVMTAIIIRLTVIFFFTKPEASVEENLPIVRTPSVSTKPLSCIL